ncbi:sugar transferase [Aeromicrobium alkaliterrae]|uniref:Sugar transferase n=1 Tax=Aeromicrobium alkaliterrae TaxID=302168 RepID=A0ABP4W1I5_9ACTN
MPSGVKTFAVQALDSQAVASSAGPDGGDPVVEVTSTRARWHGTYARTLFLTDVIAVVAAGLLSAGLRFGFDQSSVTTNGPLSLSYWSFGTALAAGWVIALQVYRTRDSYVIGEGVEEYRRIVRASVMYFGWVAIVSLVLKLDASRLYLAITFPLGLFGLLLGRKVWRAWLRRQRRHGEMVSNTLIVGGIRSAAEIVGHLERAHNAGIRVAGVWVPDRAAGEGERIERQGHSIRVFGEDARLHDVLRTTRAELVVVTDTEHLGHAGLKDLIWELEGLDIDLMLSPNVVDVSGSRIQLGTVARLPFLTVGKPTYGAAAAWPKKAFDRLGAAVIITLLAPVLLGCALAVKLTSRGPVLYGQERIGLDGQPFHMMKFRSMRVDADESLARLLAEQGKEHGPLAKLEDDPRITRAGRVLRRYSLDELPQLFNVLRGTMSLVGPRPQRQFEVERYDATAHRRLRVLPGMTGLWQVSGRSDLSWDDAVRLDTYYVENWSLVGDVLILWRTIRAVTRPDGAY